jgi:peptidoglycan/xylan/chitin deacetylase (PgdA/CDA1 family)
MRRRRGHLIFRSAVLTSSGAALAALALWTGPRWLVDPISARAPGCVYRVPTRERVVALTIDDGPSLETPVILRLLRENDAHATFFLISSRIGALEGTVKEIVAEGNELGNHMTHDRPSIRLEPAAFDADVAEAGGVIGQFAPVRWLRPGGGWYTPRMVRSIERAGYRCALGSVYPFDAQLPWSPFAWSYILGNVRPGAVIVLHDGGGRGRRTVKTLDRVLPELRARGYRVVSLSELAARGS